MLVLLLLMLIVFSVIVSYTHDDVYCKNNPDQLCGPPSPCTMGTRVLPLTKGAGTLSRPLTSSRDEAENE